MKTTLNFEDDNLNKITFEIEDNNVKTSISGVMSSEMNDRIEEPIFPNLARIISAQERSYPFSQIPEIRNLFDDIYDILTHRR